MINKEHLSDEEIQEYVLQKENYNSDSAEHVRHCLACQVKADQYQLLFETIRQQEKPAFGFDLSGSVVAKLHPPGTSTSFSQLTLFFIILSVLIPGFIVAWYFGNSLLSLFWNITPILIGLIAVTAISLLVFLFVDMYRKYHAQLKALDFY